MDEETNTDALGAEEDMKARKRRKSPFGLLSMQGGQNPILGVLGSQMLSNGGPSLSMLSPAAGILSKFI